MCALCYYHKLTQDDNDNKRFKGVDCASSSTPSSSSRLRFRDFFSYITHGDPPVLEWVEGYALVPPLTRTVNGTGHTGTSEFCATSI